MADWTLAETDPARGLARIQEFSILKLQADGPVEFRITVREYAVRSPLHMKYFAQADKQTNQKTAPFTPSGWGDTVLDALCECIQAIDLFPYEGPVS